MDERLERAARNESLLRAVNREIEQASEELGDRAGDIEVLCECGRDGCDALIRMSMSEYEAAHAQQDRFVVVPGHEDSRLEGTVAEGPGYLIVDKYGDAEEIVERAP